LTESAAVDLQEEIGLFPVGVCDISPVKLLCKADPGMSQKPARVPAWAPEGACMPLRLRPRLFHNVSDFLPILPNCFDRCGAIGEIGVVKRGALGAR
jgi:hypothetical protein